MSNTVKLNDGRAIPAIGYGAGTQWHLASSKDQINRKLVDSIIQALNLGFTHIDTAERYGTFKEVGIALKEAKIPRDKVWVTSKASDEGRNDIEKSFNESLEQLQLDYVDLYLIHTPFDINLKESWKIMEKLHQQGKAKSIGVSNFRVKDLQEILSIATIKPVVDQIEYHPYLQQDDITGFCKQNNIAIEAYSPLTPIARSTGGPVDEVVEKISKKYGRSAGQVLLRWSQQKGHVVLSTSKDPERMKDNLKCGEFDLTNEEIEAINEAGKKLTVRSFHAADWSK